MKKLPAIYTLLLIVTLSADPVLPAEYCKDYLEDGNPGGWIGSIKTFDEEVVVAVGDSVFVDIWINDLRGNVSGGRDTLIATGFEARWTENLTVKTDGTGLIPYDTAHGGPWDPFMQTIEFATNYVYVSMGNFSCPMIDTGNDMIVAKLAIKVQGGGTITFQPVEGFDTTVSCKDALVYDSEISPNTFTIRVGVCDVDEDCDDDVYCNGAESCVEGTCQPGINPCPGQICNEETHSCYPSPATTTTSIPQDSTTSTVSSTSSTIVSTTTTISSPWNKVYDEMWDVAQDDHLSLLRTFRDGVLRDSEEGRNHLLTLYYYSPEILNLLFQNPFLIEETQETIEELLPGIELLLEGKEMVITPNQVAKIESLLTLYEINASPGLKMAIKEIKEESTGKIFKQLKIQVME